jgi:hypothetical protein
VAFDQQKMFRARHGFYHSLIPTFNPMTQRPEQFYEFIVVEP